MNYIQRRKNKHKGTKFTKKLLAMLQNGKKTAFVLQQPLIESFLCPVCLCVKIFFSCFDR